MPTNLDFPRAPPTRWPLLFFWLPFFGTFFRCCDCFTCYVFSCYVFVSTQEFACLRKPDNRNCPNDREPNQALGWIRISALTCLSVSLYMLRFSMLRFCQYSWVRMFEKPDNRNCPNDWEPNQALGLIRISAYRHVDGFTLVPRRTGESEWDSSNVCTVTFRCYTFVFVWVCCWHICMYSTVATLDKRSLEQE